MKKALLIFSILFVSASISFGQNAKVFVDIDVIIGNRPPAPNEAQLMRMEEAKHPNITKALQDISDGLKHLHEAPDDFGGRKGQAEADLKQAWISLRKALYYRIYKDTH